MRKTPFKKIRTGPNLRGIFQAPVPYEKNVPSGDWSPYVSKNYEPQKWGWEDSDCCWCLSSVNDVETQLNMLKAAGRMSADDVSFFQSSGYLDVNGQFALSELFIEKLSGLADAGGTAPQAAALFRQYGMIPRSILCYTALRASMWGTRQAFDADYFNPAEVTQAMRDLGQAFLQRVKVYPAQKVAAYYSTPPQNLMDAAFMQAPVNYGIPTPDPVSLWNQAEVPYTGSVDIVHEVLGIRTPGTDGYPVLDQYDPYLKTLARGYYIGMANQIIVALIAPAAPNPVPQNPTQDTTWTGEFGWINGLLDLIGRSVGKLIGRS